MTAVQISAPHVGEAKATLDGGTLTITIPDPEPAPPAPAKAPLRIGLHPTPAEYGIWLPQLPRPWFSRVFYTFGKGLPTWGGTAITGLPAGTIRHVSFKDQLPPATIRAFLDSIPDTVDDVWLTFHHEGDIDWAGDIDGYVNYWRLLRSVVDDHPARAKVTLVNVHTQYASRNKCHLMDWRRFVLPDVADVDSWDCYRTSAVDAYEAPETLLGLPLAARREFGITRTHITEYGTHPVTGTWDTDGVWQALWYRESCQLMDREGIEAVGFWCNIDGSKEYRPKKATVLAEWTALMNQYNAVQSA